MTHRRTWNEARCLVTGATSPFGQAMARRLSAEGAQVILTVRSLPRLESVVRDLARTGANPAAFIAIDADLTEPEGRAKLVHAIDRRFGALDLVIHGAQVGLGRDLTVAQLRHMFELNLFAMLELTDLLQPLLEAGTRPAIVTLGSRDRMTEAAYPSGFPAALAAITRFRALSPRLATDSRIQRLVVTPQPAHPDRAAARVIANLRQNDDAFLTDQTQIKKFTSWLARVLKTPPPIQYAPPQRDTRLPRPHFRLRIRKSIRKGD